MIDTKEEKDFINEISTSGNYFIIFSEVNKSEILLVNAGKKGIDGFGGDAALYSEYEIDVDDRLKHQLIIGSEKDPVTSLIINNNFLEPISFLMDENDLITMKGKPMIESNYSQDDSGGNGGYTKYSLVPRNGYTSISVATDGIKGSGGGGIPYKTSKKMWRWIFYFID